ncbi:MAG: hypothetical protein OEU26_33405 [Candidatus Tectomicrobia bacterium]|nr:hypothetical protein [Candidatus Tectomicrobia bacterium]
MVKEVIITLTQVHPFVAQIQHMAFHRTDMSQADAYYRQSLIFAEELGMRPLLAHCHLGHGTLYRQTEQVAHTCGAIHRDQTVTDSGDEVLAATGGSGPGQGRGSSRQQRRVTLVKIGNIRVRFGNRQELRLVVHLTDKDYAADQFVNRGF